MNKWEKEVQQSLLNSEETAIKALDKSYKAALRDINDKIRLFDADIKMLDTAMEQATEDEKARLLSMRQSKIYQQNYQKALQGQVSGILDKLHGDEYKTIENYLKDSYTDAYVGTMYSIAKQGIPIITPINQTLAVKSILTNSKISKGLYERLGVDTAKLKKTITHEISRGIASGLSTVDIARNISNVSNAPLSRAKTIARTESHRIKSEASYQAALEAKKKGADILKQWDAVLDSKVRPTHRKVDGEIKELKEPFSNGMMYPGDSKGGAAEVVNCRCIANTRARWALDESELDELKERAEYFGLDKTDNFKDFEEKYLKAAETEKQFGVLYGKEAREVNHDYINSKEYQAKFSTLTDNKKVNSAVYTASKEILRHCDGTDHEDLYLLNGVDGSIISKVTDSVSSFGVNYTDEFKTALKTTIENGTATIAIHNHPHGTPPSSDDFRKAFENQYSKGLIIGHNGQVYLYSNTEIETTKELADQMADDIEFFYRSGWDIDRASEVVYNEHGLKYTILRGDD